MGPRSVLFTPDVLVVGAGVIGLSLALELRSRGLRVCVVDRGSAMRQASVAAAGMLAVEDPYNPPGIRDLSRLSATLYPGFLERVAALSGTCIPFQTERTYQTLRDGKVVELAERSIDPRQLAPALIAAVEGSGVGLIEQWKTGPSGEFPGSEGLPYAGIVVYATGAWPCGEQPIAPRKGQMLRVGIPTGLSPREVHRAEHVYVVPRTIGPQAGSALIGATVEDAGFDTTTWPEALARLRRMAAELVPELADEDRAPRIEAWAGLRPATPDGLPLIGELEPEQRPGRARAREFIATGHFRNGILLAPATAVVVADLIEGGTPACSLEGFSPARFVCPGAER